MKAFSLNRLFFITLMIFIHLLQYSCSGNSEKYENVTGITDTIVIVHEECTGCAEARITKGKVTLPKQVNPVSLYSGGTEIILAGKSPYSGAEIGDVIFNYNIEAIGYFAKVDSANAWGKVAVFYITEWKKLNKRNSISPD